MRERIFLLSPASCGGKRAGLLLNERASFDMAQQIRGASGAQLGDVFGFLSGLYFRGKLAYARTFALPTGGLDAVWVITPNRGLVSPDARIGVADLRSFAEVDIDELDPRYRVPLDRDVQALAARLPATTDVVLLGSVATGKYCSVLLEWLNERLLFPKDFVGRGDMSRGGLLLRSAAEGRELDYIPVAGAVLKGSRPARLPKRA